MHSSTSVPSLTWQTQPAALLAWGLLVAIMAVYALGIDRTFLIDQRNYLDHFAAAPSLQWVDALTSGTSPLKTLIVGVFSEEALYQTWAAVLGSILTPAAAVVVTVCVLNLLMALAVVRLPDPILPLILWLLLPVGFAVIGLQQLRQGFALSVMLYFALRLNRPVLGTLIAASLHTTFALALPFAVIAWLCRRHRFLALLLAVGFAFAAAYVGGMLFEAFGGRRLATYNANQTEATSILYVYGGLLCTLPSVLRLITAEAPEEPAAAQRTLASVAVVHVGVTVFTAVSFFLFPLGAGRVGYLTMLLLIPILPTIRRRDSLPGALLFSLMVVYLIYLVIKTYLEGAYDVFFTG